jgi:hypothetical protein
MRSAVAITASTVHAASTLAAHALTRVLAFEAAHRAYLLRAPLLPAAAPAASARLEGALNPVPFTFIIELLLLDNVPTAASIRALVAPRRIAPRKVKRTTLREGKEKRGTAGEFLF